MRPRRKRSSVSMLPTITEVQEGVPHFYHTQSLDDYMDSMRGLSQPSCYHSHPHPYPPKSCHQQPVKMPTPRQAKYPLMASSLSVSSSSSSVLMEPPPVLANPHLALALVAVSPESISLTLASPESAGRDLCWPQQDPLGWLFTQSQGGVGEGPATAVLPLVEDLPNSLFLV